MMTPTIGTTGEKVTASGVYKNRYGKQVTLEKGKNFPPCPEKGLPTQWEKTD